ncbi:hypothetical protein DWB85_13955 [Seongchinamella sediminis]|uniref:Uncharacterized protein n=1 Tax=Seongchinamella sediminis TaxID=2283635 RepID=A0A3L7DXE2_9GAMM|nr:hypothetical protein DWB85_13955 [Seongchinamella sediminis]
MLGRILGLNSKVYTFGELHFFEELVGLEEFSNNRNWPHSQALYILEQLLTRSRHGLFAEYSQGCYERDAQKIIESAASLKPAKLYRAFLSQEILRKKSADSLRADAAIFVRHQGNTSSVSRCENHKYDT